MFASSKHKTRRLPPSHETWVPLPFMSHAVDFLLGRNIAALVLDPGLGKTSITLEAFRILQEEGTAKRMLVVAPLRVCQLVWRQEAKKWTQFKHFKITLLHGAGKEKALKEDSDIFLINPEGVAWLVKQFPGKEFPFDTVVIDELTKFKNAQAVRHKKLLPKMPLVPRRWGLTGTLLPNGYLDLFGQMKILDNGAALGYYFSHYRNKYFEADYSGFGYELRRGAARAIENAIKPYILRMSAKDYLDLPPLIDDIRPVLLPPKARAKYNEMKKEMVAELEGGIIEAGNAAAVYSKLKQMANGAVYSGDGIFEPRKTLHVHDAKLDAMMELVEELNGQPLLIGYEFKHDLARLQEALGGNIPYIGSGVSGAQAEDIERRWNAGKIPVLLAHPSSAGHGLNFQLGNACHVAWFSCTWDFELYDQFIKRIFRQGNQALHIFNHIFIVEDTIDNKTRDAILSKGLTQSDFYAALTDEIYHDGKPATSPHEVNEREDTNMAVRKLERHSKRGGAAPAEADTEPVAEAPETETAAPARTTRRVSRRGSGIREKLEGENTPDTADDAGGDDAPVDERANEQFDDAVRERLNDADEGGEAEQRGDDPEPAAEDTSRRRTRRIPAPAAEEPDNDQDNNAGSDKPVDSVTPEIDIDALADALLDKIIERLVTLS